MIVSAIPVEYVRVVWPDVEPMLRAAVDTVEDKYTTEAILRDVLAGNLGLWVAMEDDKIIAAFTTRIVVYPKRRALAIDWVGGTKMKEWLPEALEMLGQYAADHDCKHIESIGRFGWERVLQRHGWHKEYAAYRVEV